MTLNRIRSLLGATLVLLAFGVATALPATAVAKHRPRHVTHHTRHSSGIPQHGGGDGDSDNFGGPSDGDGNL